MPINIGRKIRSSQIQLVVSRLAQCVFNKKNGLTSFDYIVHYIVHYLVQLSDEYVEVEKRLPWNVQLR